MGAYILIYFRYYIWIDLIAFGIEKTMIPLDSMHTGTFYQHLHQEFIQTTYMLLMWAIFIAWGHKSGAIKYMDVTSSNNILYSYTKVKY